MQEKMAYRQPGFVSKEIRKLMRFEFFRCDYAMFFVILDRVTGFGIDVSNLWKEKEMYYKVRTKYR